MILLAIYNRWLVFVNVILAKMLFIAWFSMMCFLWWFVGIVCVVIVIVFFVIITVIAFLTI